MTQPTEREDYCVDCGTAPCDHPMPTTLLQALFDDADRLERQNKMLKQNLAWAFIAMLFLTIAAIWGLTT